MIETTDIKSEIVGKFNLFDKKTDAFRNLRKEGIDTFQKLGLPTTRHEEWKYTKVNNLFSDSTSFGQSKINGNLTKSSLEPFLIAGKSALLIVFENGIFNASLSGDLNSLKNISISSLSASAERTLVQKHLGKIAKFENEAFVALNTAFVIDGIFIHAGKEAISETPIHILHINTSGKDQTVTTLRNLIIAEPGSKISLVESFHSVNSDCNSFINSVTEVIVDQNANVELVKAQLESDNTTHISFTQVLQERDSVFDTVTVTLGGALVRNNLHIKLNDTNCTSHLFGLYLLDGTQLVDNHTLVDHAMPNCFSNELYKGIIDGKATGVFNGKIFVRQDAQKTNAYQSNKNILLSDDAQMNTKPQLEIFADDVKCTHGATTGQLDEDALFYLRARGIGEQSARALLNIAFAGDVLNNIKCEELRNNLQALAEKKLLG